MLRIVSVALIMAIALSSCATTTKVSQIKLTETRATAAQRELLTGRWQSSSPMKKSGTRTEVAQRSRDGTYRIDFTITHASGSTSFQSEVGIWGVSGGIYFTATRGFVDSDKVVEADTSDPAFYDTDRIISLTKDDFEYKSLSNGDHFRANRIAQ